MSDLLRPQDLKKITEDTEMAKARTATSQAEKEEAEASALREAFMSREVHPEVKQRINAVVARAAERGVNEIMALSFPASYCSDGGRRINNAEPDWPDSLEGFAKSAMQYYEKELRPLGYRVQVRVMDFPGGMPGTIAMFLRW
jgi:hypothetical protein